MGHVPGYSSGSGDGWMMIQGYVRSPFLPPSPRLNLDEQPEFDRTPFVFGFPKILPNTPVKKCGHCGKDGQYRCSRCRDWYCSQKCQLNDWPRHKELCVPPPPLEKSDG